MIHIIARQCLPAPSCGRVLEVVAPVARAKGPPRTGASVAVPGHRSHWPGLWRTLAAVTGTGDRLVSGSSYRQFSPRFKGSTPLCLLDSNCPTIILTWSSFCSVTKLSRFLPITSFPLSDRNIIYCRFEYG